MQNGHPICKLAFLRPVCILDFILASGMQTGLKKAILHMGRPFCIWDLYLNGTQHIHHYMYVFNFERPACGVRARLAQGGASRDRCSFANPE